MKHGTSSTPVSVAVLTVSDTRSLESDKSGALVEEILLAAGHVIATRSIVLDEQTEIADTVMAWASDRTIQAIITTGGTGPSPRDVTPDAVLPLMDAVLKGFGELFRQLSFLDIGAAAMFSRAEAGWIDTSCGRTPVFLLPGSPKAVELGMHKLIVPQLGHLIEICSTEVEA